MSEIILDFLTPTNNDNQQIEKIEDVQITSMVDILTALSGIVPKSIYFVDYVRKEFLYISSNPLFLCGYTVKEVKSFGFDYYQKVVPKEDLQMLLDASKSAGIFYYKLPINLRVYFCIHADFGLRHRNGQTILINHKMIPLKISKKGGVLLALCIVNLSNSKQAGSIYIQMLKEPLKYNYCYHKKKFIPQPSETLSEREKQVLALAVKGYSAKDIASELCISVSTVKHHKKNIFHKCNVNNMSEAIYYATYNAIL